MSPHESPIRRVLLAGLDRFDWYAPAWERGLREIGVDVVRFDWGRLWSPGLVGRVEERFLVGPAIGRINRALVEKAEACRPDVVLVYAGLPVRPETVARLSRIAWVAGYHNDDPFGRNAGRAWFRLFRAALPRYDSHHVYREENLEDYRRLGVERVALLRSGFLPWADFPQELTDEERRRFAHDVVFAGHGEPDGRIAAVEALVEGGIDLAIHGDPTGWKRHLPPGLLARLPEIRPVLGADYRKAIGAPRLSLCFLSRANRDTYTRRVFEIPACGGFLMAERTPVMQSLYVEGEEADYFSSPEELLGRCRRWLADEPARARAAAAGRRRALESGYDVVSRMRQWLRETCDWMAAAGR